MLPDARVPEGTLAAIETSGVGPADRFRLDLGRRLTVIAGDNGLGKTLLLDMVWWAATGRWAGRPAMPFGRKADRASRLSYDLRTDAGRRTCSSRFEPSMQAWVRQQEYPQAPAVTVYAGPDGAFSIGDDGLDAGNEAPLNLPAAAGVRRIMALTYVLVWAWQEHLLASEQRGAQPARRLVLIVDELEAHLHPFWHRTILPAILDVGALLDERFDMQVIVFDALAVRAYIDRDEVRSVVGCALPSVPRRRGGAAQPGGVPQARRRVVLAHGTGVRIAAPTLEGCGARS